MDVWERAFGHLGHLVVILILCGILVMVSGIVIDDGNLVVLGGFMVGTPSLLYIGTRIVETQHDEYLERQWSPTELEGIGQHMRPMMDGAGICQACGGTLFYGRLHCPHCSESIFQGAGNETLPPEF